MTGEERQALLAEIKGIRVTDWHDAMDALGLHDRGLMSPDIRPLWRDFEDLSHCISGFAFTLRVVPSSNAIVARDVEDHRRQVGEWYAAELRWPDELTQGDLVVVEGNERLFPMMQVIPIVQEAGVTDADAGVARPPAGSQGP